MVIFLLVYCTHYISCKKKNLSFRHYYDNDAFFTYIFVESQKRIEFLHFFKPQKREKNAVSGLPKLGFRQQMNKNSCDFLLRIWNSLAKSRLPSTPILRSRNFPYYLSIISATLSVHTPRVWRTNLYQLFSQPWPVYLRLALEEKQFCLLPWLSCRGQRYIFQ